jgi:uncharacterized repeat protein (TIGR03803 family)
MAPDGAQPVGTLILDAQGNLYGTTQAGGLGPGTVFMVTPTGTETVLYRFTGMPDGDFPNAGLIQYRGDLYGTTSSGGAFGYGTVFKLTSTGTETILYNFTGGADGGWPDSTLINDALGNFYGTTVGGGTFGWGTAFKLVP